MQQCNYCGWIGRKDDIIEVDKDDLTAEGDWECPKCGITDDFSEVE